VFLAPPYTHTDTHTHTERERERQRDRETERQRERQTDRESDRQREKGGAHAFSHIHIERKGREGGDKHKRGTHKDKGTEKNVMAGPSLAYFTW